MNGDDALWALAAVAAGAVAASFASALLIPRAPAALVRVNYRGAKITAVLGLAAAFGGMIGAFVALASPDDVSDVTWATIVIIAGLFAGGLADDMRGDETAKGFGGHLRALLAGRITGGIMKMLAGGATGFVAAFLASSGREGAEIAVLIALTANLFNLLDRAPGRASKAGVLVAIPLIAFGPAAWTLASAGLWGSVAAVLPADLRERAMLGDSGANPIGGVLGLGLGLALDEPWRLVALVVVVALNLVSEKVSFSDVIERNAPLRALDRAGRPRSAARNTD